MSAAVLALQGCDVWRTSGASDLDPVLEAPCPHPAALVSRGGTVADDEISLGRVGTALIRCGAEKQAVVESYNQLKDAVNGG